jgi:hypothetical protein
MGFWGELTKVLQAPAKMIATGLHDVTGWGDFEKVENRLSANEDNESWGAALNAAIDPTQTTNIFAAGTGKVMPDWMKEGAFPALVDTIAAIIYGYPGVMATSGLTSQFNDEEPSDAWTKAAIKGATVYAGTEISGGAQGGTIPNAAANASNATVITADMAYATAYNDAIAQGLSEVEARAAGDLAASSAAQVAGKTGTDIATDTGKKVAYNTAKKYVSSNLLSGEEGTGGWSTQPRGFAVSDNPFLSEQFSTNDNLLDNIFTNTGQTGDYGTALSAVQKFENSAIEQTKLESEIFHYSGDPEYQAIEPELRVAAVEALQKGMDAKEAAKYAFEKAKKARALKMFLADFRSKMGATA